MQWINPDHKFKLSDKFLEDYKDKQPKWGPLGYVTYKRTYSRHIPEENRNEEFWETIKRVVEGCYTIQLNHCKHLKLPWNAHKSQKSAQTMYDLMWNFKFLPPGRGLWAMGTDVIWKKGGSALQNCAYTSTSDINFDFSGPFVWLMDMSMMGVGVSFDCKGAGKVKICEPKTANYKFEVEDSKEGWCALVALYLDSYAGKTKLPTEVDYSKIRPMGAPIKTFGGTAPGPEPLKNCISELKELLDSKIDQDITSGTIVDIMNIIGKCVVSGGIRRTAELALGNPDDEEYISLKDPSNKKQLDAWRWASNNSVYAEVGMDYTRLSDQAVKNGEPGFVYLENCKKYGRIKDGANWKDKGVEGVNPCLTGDTLIAAPGYEKGIRIDEIKDGTLVYCLNDGGEVAFRRFMNPRITGYNQKIYKMTLDDGMEIKCTDNHKFRLKSGEYVELKDLKEGDSLELLNRYIPDGRSESRSDQYISFVTYSKRKDFANYKYEHIEVAKTKFNTNDLTGKHVHHKDGNKFNNCLENIYLEDSTTHLSDHSCGESNPRFSGIANKEVMVNGIALVNKLKRRFSVHEWEEYAREKNLPEQFSEFRIKELGTVLEFSKKCANAVGYELPDVDPRALRTYQKAIKDGYDAFICEDGEFKVHVNKTCEVCGERFTVEYGRREQCICSLSCNNKRRDYSANREGQKIHFDKKREETRIKQIEVILDLKFQNDGEWPMKKDWETKCKELSIPIRFGAKGSPFTGYKELKEVASTYNHRVVKIEFVGYEDVWNGTVEDYHNFFIGGSESLTKQGRVKRHYVNSANCGEQPLEDRELCNLCELFPTKHKDLEDFLNTIKYAYLYAKSVTLLPTHSERTNQVMLRNRRIGLSLAGVIQAFNKFGRREFLNWLDIAYDRVTEYDREYSSWLCIPESIKKTTIKPGGTVPLLPGVDPGIHYPHSEYYIRRIIINKDNLICKALKKANVPVEDSLYGSNSYVFSFPVKSENYSKGKREVTIWEQMENAAALQYYWSDNCISQTVTVKSDEMSQVKDVLECFEDKIKTVSFLPLDTHSYKQAPYEEITKEEYEKLSKDIKNIKLSNLETSSSKAPEEIKFCDNGSCSVEISKPQE